MRQNHPFVDVTTNCTSQILPLLF